MEVCVVPFCVMEKKVGTVYKLSGKLYSPDKYPPHSGITLERCETAVKYDFVDALELAIKKHLETVSKISSIQSVSGGEESFVEGESGEDDEPSTPSVRGWATMRTTPDQGTDAQKRKNRRMTRSTMRTTWVKTMVRSEGGRIEQAGDEPSGFESEIDQAEVDEDYSLGGEVPTLESDGEMGAAGGAAEEEDTKKSHAPDSSMAPESETTEEGKQFSKPSDKVFFVEVNGLNFELHFLFRDEPHILLIAQKAAKNVYVKESGNIEQCSVIEDKVTKRIALETAGVNFRSFWQLDEYLDIDHIRSNDIHAVLRTYGVEAARAAIINEVKNVFDYYKISVDIRHLSLIADFMTVNGGYRPMNRIGAAYFGTSPFSKMTFETATKFIVEAALHGEVDTLESPSASVCLGQPVKMGTGYFDLMHNLQV
ncbi:unnamed protein product [Spirodela intermedia]|uniref:DNA-directed RNA polymerase n=1 Tax=Spirodela intermedia TaxID=51605 RepID=A0ABN7EE51_SPIIN|nr:unnamed protein product [Spirodela intermedia]